LLLNDKQINLPWIPASSVSRWRHLVRAPKCGSEFRWWWSWL